MDFKMYLVPPIRFKSTEKERFLEKLKKKKAEFRTPQKQNTEQMINFANKKKVYHRKTKSLNKNRSFILPAIVPMSAEQFRKFLNSFKRK